MKKLILERRLTLVSSVANVLVLHTSYIHIAKRILVRSLMLASSVASVLPIQHLCRFI